MFPPPPELGPSELAGNTCPFGPLLQLGKASGHLGFQIKSGEGMASSLNMELKTFLVVLRKVSSGELQVQGLSVS